MANEFNLEQGFKDLDRLIRRGIDGGSTDTRCIYRFIEEKAEDIKKSLCREMNRDFAELIKCSEHFERTDASDYAINIEWALSTQDTITWIQAWIDGTLSQKKWVEDMFEEINFHCINRCLAKGLAEKTIEYLKKNDWESVEALAPLEVEYDC